LAGIAAPAPQSPALAPEDEVAALRADIHLAIGNLEEADPILRELRDEGSSSDARRTARQAMLALRRSDPAAAEGLLRRAIELGSQDPVVWFESGMLARDRHNDRVEAERFLRRATELAPRFAHAWAELGWLEEARGAFPEAVLHFRKASSIDPRNFLYLEALAVALRKNGAAAEAEEAAKLALAAARTAGQRDQMNGLLRKWEEEGLASKGEANAPSEVKAGAPFVAAPDASRAVGLLIRIECPDKGIVFVLQRGSEEMRLEAPDPSQVQMAGSGAGRQFSCGEQKPPITVEAEFSPTPPGQAGRGRLLRLSIRN
jgi:tetratricopeptide (TPR) repeat protein